MSRTKRPELFSEEAHQRVLERICALTGAELDALIHWHPEGLPEDWPSLVVPPDELAPVEGNGSAPPPGGDQPAPVDGHPARR